MAGWIHATLPRPLQAPRRAGASTVARALVAARARVRESVIAATLAELTEVGYSDLVLPRVAERAGVALSTIHRRWGTKSALVVDAVGELTSVQVPDPDGPDLRSDLLELARAVHAMLAEPATIRLLQGMFALPADELAAMQLGHWGPRFAVAQAVVDRAIARGELPRAPTGGPSWKPIHARLWMRLLITGIGVDDAFLARVVDLAIGAAQRGDVA